MNINLFVEDENGIKTVKYNLNEFSFNIKDGYFIIVIDKMTYIFKDFSSRSDSDELIEEFEDLVKKSWISNRALFLDIKLDRNKDGFIFANHIEISNKVNSVYIKR